VKRRFRLEDDIQMHPTDIGCEGMKWTEFGSL